MGMNDLKKLLDKQGASADSLIVKANEQSFGFESTGFAYIDATVSSEGLFPRGTLSEIMGLKSTCKTTLVLHTIATAISRARAAGGKLPIILWADFENQLLGMKDYAGALGVDIAAENFIHIRPAFLEDGTNFILDAVKTGEINFLVVDSNAAMRPKEEDENGVGNTHQKGLRSLRISEFIRNLNGNMAAIANNGKVPPTAIIINQVYLKLNIGKPAFMMMGDQYDSPGSGAIKFFAGARFELTFKGNERRKYINPHTLAEDNIKTATFVELFVEKSKVCAPHKKVKFAVRYGEGVDPIMSFMKAAEALGRIKKNGARYSSIFSDGSVSISYPGWYGLYDHLRDNQDEIIAIAKHPDMHLWLPIMSGRLPWVQFARQKMANLLIKTEPGTAVLEDEEGKIVASNNEEEGIVDFDGV